jgi:hypothetical protein
MERNMALIGFSQLDTNNIFFDKTTCTRKFRFGKRLSYGGLQVVQVQFQ